MPSQAAHDCQTSGVELDVTSSDVSNDILVFAIVLFHNRSIEWRTFR